RAPAAERGRVELDAAGAAGGRAALVALRTAGRLLHGHSAVTVGHGLLLLGVIAARTGRPPGRCGCRADRPRTTHSTWPTPARSRTTDTARRRTPGSRGCEMSYSARFRIHIGSALLHPP